MGVHGNIPMRQKGLSSLHQLPKAEAQALARLGLELIRVGSLGSKELLALLCNNEFNTGVGSNNPVKRVEDLGIIPWMGCFHSPVEKGYGFLQSFKTMSKGLSDARRIQVFQVYLKTRLCHGSWEQSLEAGQSLNRNLSKRGVS